ncbi:MAG: glycosyltransferase family 4 protein, partial [Candidatus Methylomirabilia bacterium]
METTGPIPDGAMRILHVISRPGWSSDAYRAGRLTRELQDRGHRVTFVARAGAKEDILKRLSVLGVQDLLTLGSRRRRSPVRTALDLMTIRRLLHGYEVVHVHRAKEHWIAALANLLISRPIPLIRTRHVVNPVGTHFLNRWLYGRVTTHVITVSHQIREAYITSGLLEPRRVTALLGGVDHRTFQPNVDGQEFRRAHGLPSHAPLVGLLARVRSMKGHETFLKAARMVLSSRPEVRFVLVGDGPRASDIRRLAGELGVERVATMVGFHPEPERALAAFDVAVYPSLSSEGMGRVVFEYMAMGRPIVASAVGLAKEVLKDGETALLVPPGQPEPLARAIET